jgi:hypothetical protein
LVYWFNLSREEESAVGFVLVDTRTKEATFINKVNATEYAAKLCKEKYKKRDMRHHYPYRIISIVFPHM